MSNKRLLDFDAPPEAPTASGTSSTTTTPSTLQAPVLKMPKKKPRSDYYILDAEPLTATIEARAWRGWGWAQAEKTPDPFELVHGPYLRPGDTIISLCNRHGTQEESWGNVLLRRNASGDLCWVRQAVFPGDNELLITDIRLGSPEYWFKVRTPRPMEDQNEFGRVVP